MLHQQIWCVEIAKCPTTPLSSVWWKLYRFLVYYVIRPDKIVLLHLSDCFQLLTYSLCSPFSIRLSLSAPLCSFSLKLSHSYKVYSLFEPYKTWKLSIEKLFAVNLYVIERSLSVYNSVCVHVFHYLHFSIYLSPLHTVPLSFTFTCSLPISVTLRLAWNCIFRFSQNRWDSARMREHKHAPVVLCFIQSSSFKVRLLFLLTILLVFFSLHTYPCVVFIPAFVLVCCHVSFILYALRCLVSLYLFLQHFFTVIITFNLVVVPCGLDWYLFQSLWNSFDHRSRSLSTLLSSALDCSKRLFLGKLLCPSHPSVTVTLFSTERPYLWAFSYANVPADTIISVDIVQNFTGPSRTPFLPLVYHLLL